jgi:hypothetical protein
VAKASFPKQQRRIQQSRSERLYKPPTIPGNIQFTRTNRYYTTAAISAVSFNGVSVCSFFCVGTVTNSAVQIMPYSVRIKRIEIWCPANTGSNYALQNCELVWYGAGAGMSDISVTDSTVSAAYPLHINSTPPKGSSAGFWQTAASLNDLFSIDSGIGTVIDITAEFVMSDNAQSGGSKGVATAVLGRTYALPLDYYRDSTHVIVPAGLSYTY